jgi:phosphatidylglycerol:prolipoprotein diacylglycerol transferase
MASLLVKKRGYKPDTVIDFALLALPLAVIGARLYYVVFTLDRNWTFTEILNIRSGGLAFYGGLIGGTIGVIIVSIAKKYGLVNFFDMADSIIPGGLLGQAIGRWGNFFNQEAYGNLVTDPNLQFFPYAVFIEDQGAYYQATFFYESSLNFIGVILLFLLSYRLAGKYKGLVLCGYFFWYGVARALVEGLRSDSLYLNIFGTPFRVSQLLSVLLAVAGVAFAVYILINKAIIKEKTKDKTIKYKTENN